MTTTTLDDPAAVPALPGDTPETASELLTLEEARAMGFTPELIRELRENGVMEPEPGTTWSEPETLADLDALLWRRKRLRLAIATIHELANQECEIIQRQARERMAPLIRAEEAYSRFDVRFEEITRANLPRKTDGTYKAKSLKLAHATVRIKSNKGGPKVEDENQVLAHLLQRYLDHDEAEGTEPLPSSVLAAVRATLTEERYGVEALAALVANRPRTTFKVLHDPVKEYVAALPPEQRLNNDTGEVVAEFPATIPGVVVQPPSETWEWE